MLSWALVLEYLRARSGLQVDSFHISIVGLCGHQWMLALLSGWFLQHLLSLWPVERQQDQTDDGEEIKLEGVSGINSQCFLSVTACRACCDLTCFAFTLPSWNIYKGARCWFTPKCGIFGDPYDIYNFCSPWILFTLFNMNLIYKDEIII